MVYFIYHAFAYLLNRQSACFSIDDLYNACLTLRGKEVRQEVTPLTGVFRVQPSLLFLKIKSFFEGRPRPRVYLQSIATTAVFWYFTIQDLCSPCQGIHKLSVLDS